ncbi:uncharacterized protein METZ01_LOCUS378783 [marine metagenome]|uniref:Uncharacterized protein n=1 Tax=marine metagenome TaxID=408172 RepID=A0A382TV36_9ZZZZ
MLSNTTVFLVGSPAIVTVMTTMTCQVFKRFRPIRPKTFNMSNL